MYKETDVIPAGTKILVTCHVGYAGMDSHRGYLLTSDYTSKELDEVAYQDALNNAESYGYYPPSFGDDSEEDSEADDEGDGVSNNIEGYWNVVI